MDSKTINSMIAGSISGIAEAISTWPMENIKTRMQLKEGKKLNMHDVYPIIKNEGFFSLYRGITPILCSNVPKIALRFVAFEKVNEGINKINPDSKLNPLYAGMTSGLIEASLITVPSETVKTRFIEKPHVKIGNIIKSEGITGMYKGYWPTVGRQCMNQSSRFFFYQNYKDYYKKTYPTREFGKIESFM